MCLDITHLLCELPVIARYRNHKTLKIEKIALHVMRVHVEVPLA